MSTPFFDEISEPFTVSDEGPHVILQHDPGPGRCGSFCLTVSGEDSGEQIADLWHGTFARGAAGITVQASRVGTLNLSGLLTGVEVVVDGNSGALRARVTGIPGVDLAGRVHLALRGSES